MHACYFLKLLKSTQETVFFHTSVPTRNEKDDRPWTYCTFSFLSLRVVQQSLCVWNMLKDWRWNKTADSYLHGYKWVNAVNIELLFFCLSVAQYILFYGLSQNNLCYMCWDMSVHQWHNINKFTLLFLYIYILFSPSISNKIQIMC